MGMRVNVHITPEVEYDPDIDPHTVIGWYNDEAIQLCVGEGSIWTGDKHIGPCSYLEIGREDLTLTAGGRWVLHHDGTAQSSGPPWRRYLTDEQARQWLLRSQGNEEILAQYFPETTEERGPGRPTIGNPVTVRLGETQPRLDTWATSRGITRADAIRQLVDIALDHFDTTGAIACS
jgi:hypothetical protein